MPDHPHEANEVRLIFKPLPGSPPWPHRVRTLLKIALRALRLKCIRIEGLTGSNGFAQAATEGSETTTESASVIDSS